LNVPAKNLQKPSKIMDLPQKVVEYTPQPLEK